MPAAPLETQCDLSHRAENERMVGEPDLLPELEEGHVSLSLWILVTLGFCALPTSVFLTAWLPDGGGTLPPFLWSEFFLCTQSPSQDWLPGLGSLDPGSSMPAVVKGQARGQL